MLLCPPGCEGRRLEACKDLKCFPRRFQHQGELLRNRSVSSGHRWPGPLPVGPQAAVKAQPRTAAREEQADLWGASWLPAGLPDGWRPSLPPELELGWHLPRERAVLPAQDVAGCRVSPTPVHCFLRPRGTAPPLFRKSRDGPSEQPLEARKGKAGERVSCVGPVRCVLVFRRHLETFPPAAEGRARSEQRLSQRPAHVRPPAPCTTLPPTSECCRHQRPWAAPEFMS